ncbi:MAG: hypothetical protein LQ342_008457 [Letrouitia transgressa]|nr:MAG: hypothetical protein LQ342_008457 [Letrouitia transgressa]
MVSISRKIWWKIWDSKTKIKWMLFTILVPEYLMGKAISERYSVESTSQPYSKKHPPSVRIYLANMGYFVLDWGNTATYSGDDTATCSGDDTAICSEDDEDLKTTRTELQQAIKDVLDRKDLPESQRINISRLKSRFWALNAQQWNYLESKGIARLPETPEWQLERLDSSSALVKLLAVIQVLWLIVQLISREIRSQPSSQLEISALAFAVCSIVTYIAYWKRPQDVEAVCFIKAGAWNQRLNNSPNTNDSNTDDSNTDDPNTDDPKTDDPNTNDTAVDLIRALGRCGPQYLWLKPRVQSKIGDEAGPKPIPNDGTHMGSMFQSDSRNRTKELVPLILGAVFGGLLFGGLHCLAWKSKFPTPGEALGWKICSIATTGLPIISLPLFFVFPIISPWDSKKTRLKIARRCFFAISFFFVFLPYVLARLFLIAESVRSLFFLPPEAFVNTWTDLFPHGN